MNTYLFFFALAAWLFIAPTLANVCSHFLIRYIATFRAKRRAALLRKHKPLLVMARDLLRDGNMEGGEMKLQEFAKKTGEHIGVMTLNLLTEEMNTQIFHPEVCDPDADEPDR